MGSLKGGSGNTRVDRTPLSVNLVQVALVGLVIFLALNSVLDARSLYSDSEESSPVGSTAAVASLTILGLCIASILLSLRDRRIRLGLVQLVAFFAFAALYLLRLIHDGFVPSVGTLLAVIVIFAVSVQAAYSAKVLESVKWSLRLILIASLVAAVVEPDWALVPPESAGRALFGFDTRLIGFSASPNYLATGAGVLFLLECFSARRAKKWVWFSWLLLCIVVLGWTQSRSVILGVSLAGAIYLVARRTGKQNRYFIAVTWILIGLSWVIPFLTANNIRTGTEGFEDFTTGRTNIWFSAWSEMGEFWRFGVPTYDARVILGAASNAHNQILELLMAGGIVALLSMATLLVTLSVIASRDSLAGPLGGALLVYTCSQFIFGTPLRVMGLSWNLLAIAVLVLQISAHQQLSIAYRQGHAVARTRLSVRNTTEKS